MLAGEIIKNDESALGEIIPQSQHLGVIGAPEPRLRHVRNGILAKLRIIERENVAGVDAHPRAGQLTHNFGEVPFAARVIMAPR